MCCVTLPEEKGSGEPLPAACTADAPPLLNPYLHVWGTSLTPSPEHLNHRQARPPTPLHTQGDFISHEVDMKTDSSMWIDRY